MISEIQLFTSYYTTYKCKLGNLFRCSDKLSQVPKPDTEQNAASPDKQNDTKMNTI